MLTIVIFAVVPLEAAVGLCDFFYAMMALPTMITVIALSHKVRSATREYISSRQLKSKETINENA